MKKIYFILSLSLLLLSCNMGQRPSSMTLTVTIEPQRYFLEQIVGDKFEVNTLVPPGASPETYEPSPMAMINLGNSKAYFKVGFLGYENAWSGKLAQNNPNVIVVDCSEGIDLMYGTHGPHSHGEEDDHEHDHGPDAVDPHVWSSAKNAIQFSKNMLDALVEFDATNADYYRRNFEELVKKISEVDTKITSMLDEGISSRSFIIYHPALSYFARDYDLKQFSIEFNGKSPSPAQMKELVDLARSENINVVLIQQEFDVKNTQVISSEIGAKSYVINPLTYEWDEELIRLAKILSNKEQ